MSDVEYFIDVSDASGLKYRWPDNGSSGSIKVAITNDSDPPTAVIDLNPAAEVGEPYKVTAKVTDEAGISWVRLRYRHLTQFEDYKSVEMKYNESSGKFEGIILGSFIVPEWDLIYFIECMDHNGIGRMYPDMDVEMPYVILKVRR